MKLSLTKTQSCTIPTLILSSLKQYESLATSSIANKQQQLTQWFIDSTLRHEDHNIPRIQLLSRAQDIVKGNISNPKMINTLFLDENSVISLIQESNYLVDIAFVLAKHQEMKVKATQYAMNILTAAKTKVQQLVKANIGQIQYIFCVNEVNLYIDHKKSLPEALYIVDEYDRVQMQTEAILIFNYLFKPIFERKSLTNVYEYLYPMVYWFAIIKDETIEKEMTLMELAKKIDSFLWAKKTAENISFVTTFTKILDLLSLKHLQQDTFSPFTLAPLLLKLKNCSYGELINNWMATQPDKKAQPKLIENIFRNSLNSGCTVFCFHIIDAFSNYLLRIKNFDALLHLFNSFIKKQYLSIKLPDGSFVRAYMNILMLYAVGFINRDRLDGETELERLAENLSELVCKPRFKYDSCYAEIVLFFRIYENRFQFLSAKCKKFVSELEEIYKVHYPIASLHQEVSKRIFKEYSADYDEDSLYSLQKSNRYAGLLNLGNTCYINSFMQALFMTKKFKTQIIKAQDQGIIPTDHPIFKALVHLFVQLNTAILVNKTEVQPASFKKSIPQPFKTSWDQHDSGEFGRMFLDSVTTQLKDTPLADKIDRLFTQELVSKIICKGCNSQRDKKEKIFDFILNVDDSTMDAITASDLLKKFFKGHELDNNNMIFCPNCKNNRPALVVNQPLELAQHLIATISIFKFDKNGSSKIIKPLNFEFSLNFKNILPKIVTQDQIYELYAFVLHIGTGVQRGHYQCFARNLEQNPMLWYKFDDHYVTEQEINSIEDFHFGQNQTPYILFYSSNRKSRKIFTPR